MIKSYKERPLATIYFNSTNNKSSRVGNISTLNFKEIVRQLILAQSFLKSAFLRNNFLSHFDLSFANKVFIDAPVFVQHNFV